MSNYEKEFQIFASNTNQAARSFYYHKEIHGQVGDDIRKYQEIPEGHPGTSELFQAMNANAQFWNDFSNSSSLFSLVTLGRIFDKPSKSHGIARLIKEIQSTDLFSKSELRKRKIAGSDNSHEWIDGFMQNIRNTTREECDRFLLYVADTQKLWIEIKDVRNKLYAHQDIISPQKESEILGTATDEKIEKIILRLLTIKKALWEAFNNGANLNLEYGNTGLQMRVQTEVATLLDRLR